MTQDDANMVGHSFSYQWHKLVVGGAAGFLKKKIRLAVNITWADSPWIKFEIFILNLAISVGCGLVKNPKDHAEAA